VKKTFGSKDGVWEYLQDAIGEIVSRKDTVMSYLQFCQGMTDLSDESNFGHFRRLVDFYFYILNPSKVTEIESALDSLEKFLGMNAVEQALHNVALNLSSNQFPMFVLRSLVLPNRTAKQGSD
jgi:hypothetical protein